MHHVFYRFLMFFFALFALITITRTTKKTTTGTIIVGFTGPAVDDVFADSDATHSNNINDNSNTNEKESCSSLRIDDLINAKVSSKPFKHVYVKGFISKECVRKVNRDFPESLKRISTYGGGNIDEGALRKRNEIEVISKRFWTRWRARRCGRRSNASSGRICRTRLSGRLFEA